MLQVPTHPQRRDLPRRLRYNTILAFINMTSSLPPGPTNISRFEKIAHSRAPHLSPRPQPGPGQGLARTPASPPARRATYPSYAATYTRIHGSKGASTAAQITALHYHQSRLPLIIPPSPVTSPHLTHETRKKKSHIPNKPTTSKSHPTPPPAQRTQPAQSHKRHPKNPPKPGWPMTPSIPSCPREKKIHGKNQLAG